jgi:hypothetical protein
LRLRLAEDEICASAEGLGIDGDGLVVALGQDGGPLRDLWAEEIRGDGRIRSDRRVLLSPRKSGKNRI